MYDGLTWQVDARRAGVDTLSDGQIVRLTDCPLPVCCLTYDCERGAKSVRGLTVALAKSGARATGFWLGTLASGAPDALAAWRLQGNDVGLHSWSHRVQPRLADGAFTDEVRRAGGAVARATGVPSDHLYRFPYGSGCSRETGLLRDLGFQAFFWSIDTRDWTGRSAAQVVSSAGQAGRGGIVLMHDTGGAIGACVSLVAKLRAKGLEPVPLSFALAPVYAQPRFPIPGPILPGAPESDTQVIEDTSEGAALASPGGRWVVLILGGRLCLWDTENASGVAVATNVAAVSWSPDGEFLAVTSAAPDAHVYTLDPAVTCAVMCGQAPGPVANCPSALRVSSAGVADHRGRFSADGRALLWERERGGRSETVRCGLRQVAPWAVLSVPGPPGAKVEVRIRGAAARRANAPCRLVLPAGTKGASGEVRVSAVDGGRSTSTTVPLELGAEVTLSDRGDAAEPPGEL